MFDEEGFAEAAAAGSEAGDGEGDEQGERPEYLGTAIMVEDGTIILTLRAEGPDGIIGHGVLKYPPDDKRYEYILNHVGPIKPGETVLVRPFPDD